MKRDPRLGYPPGYGIMLLALFLLTGVAVRDAVVIVLALMGY